MAGAFMLKPRGESDYFKERNPYFDTRAEYGREEDTIIFISIKTPKGKISKYHATLRFNSERKLSNEDKTRQLVSYLKELEEKTFKREFKKGYTFGEVIVYSGEI